MDVLSQVDFTERNFLAACLAIVLQPTVWTILARSEHNTRWMSSLFGSAQAGVHVIALIILAGGRVREYMFEQAVGAQPTLATIKDNELLSFYLAWALIGSGMTLVMSSFYQLGWNGTYLGDYFGILMKERVTGFPFSVCDNPMYIGSTMIYLGHSFQMASPAGFALTAVVAVVYLILLRMEEPFTAKIYAERDNKRKA